MSAAITQVQQARPSGLLSCERVAQQIEHIAFARRHKLACIIAYIPTTVVTKFGIEKFALLVFAKTLHSTKLPPDCQPLIA